MKGFLLIFRRIYVSFPLCSAIVHRLEISLCLARCMGRSIAILRWAKDCGVWRRLSLNGLSACGTRGRAGGVAAE